MAKISTTQKVLNALRVMLNQEENRDGLTLKEVWTRLDSIPAIKKEIYGADGKRRENILTGLTTRIKNHQIQGIRVMKNSDNKLTFIAISNDFEYLKRITEDYLKNVSNLKLETEECTEEEKVALSHFKQIITYLEKLDELLKAIAIS